MDIPWLNQVITGDCRLLAEQLPGDSIGMIMTSPPYNIGLKYSGFDDNMDGDDFVEFNRQWLTQAYRVMKETSRLYVVVSEQMLWWFRDLATDCGFRYAQKLTWCKPNLVGGVRIGNDWHNMSEDILLFRKGKRVPMLSDARSNAFNWQVVTAPQTNFREGRVHPAQWPISLCLRIICRTPGEPLLDMFAGSGSALVACKILGRQYIGFELVPEVAEVARQRLFNTQPLFTTESRQLEMGLPQVIAKGE